MAAFPGGWLTDTAMGQGQHLSVLEDGVIYPSKTSEILSALMNLLEVKQTDFVSLEGSFEHENSEIVPP